MYDAVIVGAGHNGLICATYLALAGVKTLVLERRAMVGGACVSEEVWPGYKVSTASYLMSLLQPKIILDLDLQKHGLEVLKPDPTFMPFGDDHSVVFWEDVGKVCEEFRQFSEKDAAIYPEYLQNMRRLVPVVRNIIWETPLDIQDVSPSGLLKSAKFLLKYAKYRDLFYEMFDVLTMSAYDYLSKWFESDEVIAAIGYYVTGGGTNRSMTMPTTAFCLLRPLLRDNATPAGGGGFVRGGMGGISDAIAASGKAAGLEIRTDSPVAEILTEGGAVTGVRLESGEEIATRCVISNANAKTTFLRLVKDSALPVPFQRDIRNIRTKSSLFKVHLAVSKLPDYTAFSREQRGFDYPAMVRIGSTVDYLETAFQAQYSGHPSQDPFLTIMAPSVYDDTLAPAGKHLLVIMGGHAPCGDSGMTREAMRAEILHSVTRCIEKYAPGFADHIVESDVLTPLDLEDRFDLPDGHVHHGDLTLDQAFFRRPAPGFADYRTPVTGLYLCGSAVHPGGGVTGVPGHNAAREILRDMKRRGPVFKQLNAKKWKGV